MIILIGIIYVLYQLIKAAGEDAEIKRWCQSKGYDTYPSSTGLRDVKTDKHCYVDPMTGEKTLW